MLHVYTIQYSGLCRVGWKLIWQDSIKAIQFVCFHVNLTCWIRFVQDLVNMALPGYAEWVKNVVDSSAFISISLKRFVSLNVSSTCPKSICTRFNKYSGTGLCRMGSKCCQFDAIWLNWCHKSTLMLCVKNVVNLTWLNWLNTICLH